MVLPDSISFCFSARDSFSSVLLSARSLSSCSEILEVVIEGVYLLKPFVSTRYLPKLCPAS